MTLAISTIKDKIIVIVEIKFDDDSDRLICTFLVRVIKLIRAQFLPYFPQNPYQTELARALFFKGVLVHLNHKAPQPSHDALNPPLPDILHLHWVYPYIIGDVNDDRITLDANSKAFIRKIIKLKSFGVKVVWTIHNLLSHECNNPSVELFSRRALAQICDKIIVHCHYAEEKVKTSYKVSESRIRVIPHGSYIENYPNKISRSEAKKILGFGSEVVYLCFGQIRRYKGLLKAIDAYLLLRAEAAIALIIVGNPSDKGYLDELETICAGYPNIRLIPKYVPSDEVQIYLNAADIVVCPYQDILTSGMVILAMSFCRIIVAPAIGCIPETTKGYSAVLYNPLKVYGLYEAMKNALKLYDNETSIMHYDFHGMTKQSSWATVAEKTRRVYLECLCKKSELRVEL